jgi:hypothetical protein
MVFGLDLVMFEILDGAFVFLGSGAGIESSEVAFAVRGGIKLPRIEPVFSAGKFSYHTFSPALFSLKNANGVLA